MERALESASIPFIDIWADMVGFREWDYDKVISLVSDFIRLRQNTLRLAAGMISLRLRLRPDKMAR